MKKLTHFLQKENRGLQSRLNTNDEKIVKKEYSLKKLSKITMQIKRRKNIKGSLGNIQKKSGKF